MNTYKKTLDYLYNKLPYYQRAGKVAYKANLNNSINLDNYFGNPHKRFKCIHIAGTNGKGSVSHMIASILQTAGYKVGLYTSPHLKDFRERIKINGKEIPKEEVICFVKDNINIFNKIKPSFFEITVIMAFYYFAKERVDFAVIEVGLGGRLDSTNIITPEISIITNISLDHTDLLGNSKELIAKEKAGIIKENIPVIKGQSDTEIDYVFKEMAYLKNTKLYFADKIYSINYSMLSTDNKQILNLKKNNKKAYSVLKLDLQGYYQKFNVLPVLLAIDILNEKGLKINDSFVYKGLENTIKNTGIRGRWEVIGSNPLIVCDTAHNEEGIKQVVNQLNNTPYKKLHMVIGFVNDKKLNKILKLLPEDAIYYFTRAHIPRAMNEIKLQDLAAKYSLFGESFTDVKKAYTLAKSNANTNDLIFIGGSTFVVAEVI